MCTKQIGFEQQLPIKAEQYLLRPCVCIHIHTNAGVYRKISERKKKKNKL